MRYDVNFIFLGLLLVVIVAMIAMVFYYNITYGGLRERYDLAMRDMDNRTMELNKTMQEVNAKEAVLQEKERLLLDYIQELNLSKERETSLGSHFTELTSEKTLLADQLNQTRLERNSYATLYTKTKESYDVCNRNYDVKATELTSANNRISSIKGWLVEARSNSESISSSAGSVGDKAGSIQTFRNNASVVNGLANDIEDEASAMQSDASRITYIIDQIRST